MLNKMMLQGDLCLTGEEHLDLVQNSRVPRETVEGHAGHAAHAGHNIEKGNNNR